MYTLHLLLYLTANCAGAGLKTELTTGPRAGKSEGEQTTSLDVIQQNALFRDEAAEEGIHCKHNSNKHQHPESNKDHQHEEHANGSGAAVAGVIRTTENGGKAEVRGKGVGGGTVSGGRVSGVGVSGGRVSGKGVGKVQGEALTATVRGQPREGKAIQEVRGGNGKKTAAAGVQVKEAAAEDAGRDDGDAGRDDGAAVLAARDDRQMEEFRAAKHFNCTGRGPGLYADVNTGCKVGDCYVFCYGLTWLKRRKDREEMDQAAGVTCMVNGHA